MKRRELKSLGIVGTVGVPAKYGGFETLAHHLVLNLNKQFNITVYCSESAYEEKERVSQWQGAQLEYIPLKANGSQSILYDLWSMIRGIKQNDYLLILGVSAGIFIPILKLFTKKKFIFNIDGLEWRRPKWNWLAKKFLLWSEKIVCKHADEIVTDNRILQEYVKIRYSRESHLIEYGADHTQKRALSSKILETFPFLKDKYAFKVARIEPENHIHTVLEAFAKVKDQTLVLVGNWNASYYGEKLRKYYKQFENLHLLDPIYETSQLDVLRSNAHIYIHGHSAGGTNPSLVEAMSLELPVIAFDAIFNRVTTNNQAVFFNDAKELEDILKKIEGYPLFTIAEKLKKVADRKYTWKSISSKYAKVFFGKTLNEIQLPELKPVRIREAAAEVMV